MRTVLFGLGTRGDLELLIALGWELLQNGHKAVIGAHDFYGPRVEAAGLQFSSLGDGTQADLQSIVRGLAAYPSPLQRTQY
jgi:UDP:flavonoid glycosyltransferase YjiC (YdhE family)